MSQASETGKTAGCGLVIFVLSLTTLTPSTDTNIANGSGGRLIARR